MRNATLWFVTALLTMSATIALGATTSVRGDFDGDRKSDVILQSLDAPIAIWELNGGAIKAGAVIGGDGWWFAKFTGDFNADGKADVILQKPATGDIAEWQMNGTSIIGGAVIANPGTDWEPVASGDFNGDGKSDILLQNAATGAVAVWLMDGVTITGGAVVGTPPVVWRVKATGDFNGDGKSDIILQNSTTGEIAEWQMNSTAISAGLVIGGPGPAWEVRAADDFNGDGKADIIMQNTSTGTVAEWQMNGNVIVAGAIVGDPGSAFVVRATGDYDGDGKSDILLRSAGGDIAVWQLNGSSIVAGALVASPGSRWMPAPLPALEALPQTFDTLAAAANLGTGSGDMTTTADCGSPQQTNCPNGTPVSPLPLVRITQSSLSVTQSAGGSNFSATLSAATLTDVPITFPVIGVCMLKIDTTVGTSPTITVGGSLTFDSQYPSGPINRLNLSNLQLTGLENSDYALSGSFGCSTVNFSASNVAGLLTFWFQNRMYDGAICGVEGPALFTPCPFRP